MISMQLHVSTVKTWRGVAVVLVMEVITSGKHRCRNLSSLSMQWAKMLLMEPAAEKKWFPYGKHQLGIAEICWVIINISGLAPPVTAEGSFTIHKYLSADFYAIINNEI